MTVKAHGAGVTGGSKVRSMGKGLKKLDQMTGMAQVIQQLLIVLQSVNRSMFPCAGKDLVLLTMQRLCRYPKTTETSF